MSKIKYSSLALAVLSALILTSCSDDSADKPAPPPAAAPPVAPPPAAAPTVAAPSVAPATNAAPAKTATNEVTAARPNPPKQAEAASTNAVFGTVAATDDAYKSALDAHALEDAVKLVGKEGSFKGTVVKVFEPRGLAVIEFDPEYTTALTAIVRGKNFDKFPALTNLIGKQVLVTGTFAEYRGAAQLVLEKPEQIKVLEAAK